MRILVLGGTAFLGRHFVDAALAREHEVTVFTRGRRTLPWTNVDHIVGDRDPAKPPGIEGLVDGTWDVAIDTSGYVPRVAGASADLLRDRVQRYLFVSSLSVYADSGKPGIDENAPVATLADAASEEIMRDYGALKGACERAIDARFGERATIVRPGLIVGPFDGSDRFGYWVARFVDPDLLGDRAREAVVPAPPERAIQVIDARDLAQWMLLLVERDIGGVFNACSPAGQWTMHDLVAASANEGGSRVEPAWVPEELLVAAGVVPWTGLPLWIPASDPEHEGFMRIDCSKAARAGLCTRALAETVRDTAAWLRSRGSADVFRNVLAAAQEREILARMAIVR